MYNPFLDTFLTVADCGSFTKAANSLYISPTAVMKQINSLETHLGVQLFTRTQKGATLTDAGKLIYKDAQFIKDYSLKAVATARTTQLEHENIFCVGTSLLNPAKAFMDLWYKVSSQFPTYKLHLVPFEDTHAGILNEIKQLGEKFDFLVGVCDSKAWLSLCEFLPLGRYQKMIAVTRNHPLAQKYLKKKKRSKQTGKQRTKTVSLSMKDLYGYTLMMVKEGDSGLNDFIRHDILKNHPRISIEDTPPFYDISVFNECAESQKILLTIECWTEVHPGLISIPIDWDYSIPYGLLYAKHASDEVARFVHAVSALNSADAVGATGASA